MRLSKTPLLNVFFLVFTLTAVTIGWTDTDGTAVDPDLPPYTPVEGVSGAINSIGSDTMNNLMTLWAEGFRRHYPNVTVEIEGKGSSTAPAALVAGTANFGPMSRRMRGDETDAFEDRYGYPPTLLFTGIDLLAVYVNRENPIEGMTLQQVDAVFSQTRRGGYPSDIRTWGELGLEGPWANLPISLYGRNAASGTYGYFKDYALFGGDFKSAVREQPGSSSVVQGVASDRAGIGYSGIGYATADVRAVPLAQDEDDEFFPAHPKYAYTGDYPLSRFLYVYINYQPGSQLDPLRREFVKYIVSADGQQDVIRDGYLPLPATVARDVLKSVGLEPEF